MSDITPLVQSFVAVTSASPYLAEQYLARNGNDLTGAIEDFYSSIGERDSGSDSRPEPQNSASRPRAAPRTSGIRTLADLGNDAEQPDDRTDANFFTGGEKSALQVENPDKKKKKAQPSLVERIFQRASEQMNEADERPSAHAEEEAPATFSGTGFRLGDSSSASASEVIRDPSSGKPKKALKVNREITFWRQGFTVADGPLRRYDDPENDALLRELKSGRVPVALLDVEFGQDVDVSVVRKMDEDYTPPKQKAGGFHGSGQRLGSPVPGEELGVPAYKEETVAAAPQPQPEQKKATGAAGEGDSLVQIRFANGKRASHKFHASDSISVVYAFVRAHDLNDDPSRPFVLSHTFPVKPIEESDETTVASAQLKNAVIVQRWK